MSDVSQGPGWWQASDGRWYPPDQRPGLIPQARNPNPHLASSSVVVQAPMSFSGSARRLWKPVNSSGNPAAKVALGALMVFLIATAWFLIAGWYLVFGLLLVPYRLIRRGGRKRKQEDLRHREMMAAVRTRR